jgi:hypothetical protein
MARASPQRSSTRLSANEQGASREPGSMPSADSVPTLPSRPLPTEVRAKEWIPADAKILLRVRAALDRL